MPHQPEPYWRSSTDLEEFPTLNESISTPTLVVGGGITGITTAYLLAKAGIRTVLVEAGKVLNGTTGHTTAKITAQHDVIYDELIQHFGKDQAKLYYESNIEAGKFIKKLVDEHQISCDYSIQDAYLYSTTPKGKQQLEKEAEAYKELGINGELQLETKLPFETTAALSMKDQAQFHPLHYLKHLLDDFIKMGGTVYENTTAKSVEEADHPIVTTHLGYTISCNHLVIASHFPFYDWRGLYFTRMHAERSYVLAIKSKTAFPGGMYLSVDNPTRSLRSVQIDGSEHILVGGESHKTGQGIPTIEHYEALQKFAEEHFELEEIAYRWSAQDLITLDKIPYIGPITSRSEHIYVATGFRKWGMTTSTLAAQIISDAIAQRENRYSELFHPSRFKPDPSIKELVVQNADVAKHLVEGKLEIVQMHPEDLQNDEGGVVKFEGKRAGAYRNELGQLHIVDTTCTHLGCELEWNSGDRTWDCPCHASRFSVEGQVIEGPAKKPLKKLL
nr:FAD-dependent oxidoreductase [Peribacillus alkalitolerans]